MGGTQRRRPLARGRVSGDGPFPIGVACNTLWCAWILVEPRTLFYRQLDTTPDFRVRCTLPPDAGQEATEICAIGGFGFNPIDHDGTVPDDYSKVH